VLEISQPAFLLVRRQICGREVDAAKVELLRRSARHRQMAQMYGIKSSAKKSYPHAVICSASS
jgi:hypothetical protein